MPHLESAPRRLAKRLLPKPLYGALTRRNRLLTISRPRARLVLAWRVRRLRSRSGTAGVARLDRVLVINLAKRPDRLSRFHEEMHRLGIAGYRRVEAVEREHGALGCALSHLACVRQLVDESLDCVMICEDDVRFDVSRDELDALVEAFLDDEAEVALLAYTHHLPPMRHGRLFVRAPAATMTAVCYLVKRSIAEDLARCFEDAARELARGGDLRVHQIDTAWWDLQARRLFVLPIVRAAGHYDGYSDIAHRFVSYPGL